MIYFIRNFLLLIVCCISVDLAAQQNNQKLSGALQQTLLGKPLICGHRGGFDSTSPENSLQRFKQAAANASGQPVMLELDVRKSRDGQLYIMHDTSLERTTNGHGAIKEVTSSYINKLVLKNMDGNLTKEHIPDFASVLDWLVQQDNVYLMLDIKDDLWAEAISLVKTKGAVDKCLVLTFNPVNTAKVYRLCPNMVISALVNDQDDWSRIEELKIPATQLVVYINNKTPDELTDRLHQQKIFITADVSENVKLHPSPFAKDYYEKYVDAKKIDLLITDYPDVVLTYFR